MRTMSLFMFIYPKDSLHRVQQKYGSQKMVVVFSNEVSNAEKLRKSNGKISVFKTAHKGSNHSTPAL